MFHRVVHSDDASGFNGYIESVEMFDSYKMYSIWSHRSSNDVPVKSIKSRKDLMVALEETETDRQVCRMIMQILEAVAPLPNDDLIAARTKLPVKSII